MTPPPEDPQAGPSGGAPEEDTVIPEDDNSVRVISPEDFPVGRDAELEAVVLMIRTPCRPKLMCVFVSEFYKKFKIKRKII